MNYGDLAIGEVVEKNHEFSIDSVCPDNEILEFYLDISTGETAKFILITQSLLFEITEILVNGSNAYLERGVENTLCISVNNIGSLDAINTEGILSLFSNAAYVIDSTYLYGDILSGETGEFEFSVQVEDDCYIGRNIPFNLEIEDENGLVTDIQFSLEVGLVEATSPTGPDSFGYYAYDSNDTEYSECPVYNWYELDPEQGGEGEVIEMVDDDSQTIPLPFDFTYYNTNFDSITICSNGWISFETTWMTNFRNWNIPAALGPNAQVCAYWDDLIGEPLEPNLHKDMRICYDYFEEENLFIIEWNECYNRFDDTSVEKFEIILFDPEEYTTTDGNGIIQFNYHTINNPDANNNYSTVGMENMGQTGGLLYTYANIYPASASILENNLAIKFTTDQPDNYYLIDAEIEKFNACGLSQNYPNPFSESTTISFFSPRDDAMSAKINIFNIKGQLIKTIKPENSNSPDYEPFFNVSWDGKDENGNPSASGIYFYKLEVEGQISETKRMLFIK